MPVRRHVVMSSMPASWAASIRSDKFHESQSYSKAAVTRPLAGIRAVIRLLLRVSPHALHGFLHGHDKVSDLVGFSRRDNKKRLVAIYDAPACPPQNRPRLRNGIPGGLPLGGDGDPGLLLFREQGHFASLFTSSASSPGAKRRRQWRRLHRHAPTMCDDLVVIVRTTITP
ncbi:hypothetical protein MN608_05099 [Microdochium nivale]|nr:hypothetical protein MN608_05099 [Microdochium nivale]